MIKCSILERTIAQKKQSAKKQSVKFWAKTADVDLLLVSTSPAATCPSPATGPRAIVPGPYIKGILWGWAQRTSSEWTHKGVLFYPFFFCGIIILISNKLKYGSIWNKPLRNEGPLFGIMVTIFLGSSFWHWPFLTHDQARVSIKPRSCGFLWSPIWLVFETPSTRDNDPWPTSKEFMSNPKKCIYYIWKLLGVPDVPRVTFTSIHLDFQSFLDLTADFQSTPISQGARSPKPTRIPTCV